MRAAGGAAQRTKCKEVLYDNTILVRIRSSVIKWNDELICNEVGRSKKWKQILKKIFVKLTQLDCPHPAVQKKQWQTDLKKAGNETIAAVCPDWPTDPAHRATYDLICKEMNREKSPRPDWLREAAFSWLESLPGGFQNTSWYPDDAIRVAHQLFLRGSAKFQTFINALKNRKSSAILELIEAHEAAPGRLCIAFSVYKNVMYLNMRLSA